MTRLDDYLKPLYEGVWEVTIPKESVTEPLDGGWKKSTINVPSPGTIASYRKGQYHVHETENEWKVHLDRYDPKRHPFLHLIDDAPLLLMIAGTFGTLISHAKGTKSVDTEEILKEQKASWLWQVLLGFSFLILGFYIISDPVGFVSFIFGLFIFLMLIALGGGVILNSLRSRAGMRTIIEGFLQGGCICALGVLTLYLPVDLWNISMLMVFAFWAFASSILLLFRVAKGPKAVPEGFLSRLAIGCFSLLLAYILLKMPLAGEYILLLMLGGIVVLTGIVLIINGLRLWGWMRASPAPA